MAKEREDISHEESKSTSSEDRARKSVQDNEDLRVVAVIENNDVITKKSDETTWKATQAPKASGNGRNVEAKPEVILLDEAPIGRTSGNAYNTRITPKFYNNPRVIELSDDKSKMELRREFKVDVANPELSVGNRRDSQRSPNDEDDEDDGSADILSRLPPGTILIKQAARRDVAAAGTSRDCAPDDSDYVHDSSKDSTGTNSSESSSTASYNTGGKVRRMQYRSVRSKKVVEVRRNPARNKKKKPIDEDFTRPRQRLLALKRTSSFIVDNATRKRSRTTPTPYMNTRSVTRKLYTVGATYQAPTANDALEWKEWPSHGMHERPIWHSQVGLAYEYNERSFVSLDGESYREIIEEPVIEVVSVDPNPERMAIPHGRRNLERVRYYNPPRSLDLVDKRESFVQDNSFQACMHGSFHSVLAYCARVVTPTYRRNVDLKIRAYSRSDDALDNAKLPMNLPEVGKFPQVPVNAKFHQVVASASGSGPASSACLTKIPEASSFPNTGTSGELPKCLVIPRKTIHFTNVRNIQGNILQEVFNRSSKNTLIFLKPTDPPGKAAEKIAAALNNSTTSKVNPTKSKDCPGSAVHPKFAKLDDNAISDEALMEMSSMYNNILPNDENDNTCAKAFKPTSYLTRPVTALVATKIPIKSSDSPMDNSTSRPSCSGIRSGNLRASVKERSNDTPRFAYSNQAAEIAKILAEYNQKAARYSPTGMRSYTAANVLNVRTMSGGKTVKSTDQCANGPSGRNTFLSFVEHPKNMRIKREQDVTEAMNLRGSFNVNRQPCAVNHRTAPATITSGSEKETANDDIQAMDLTTAKPRDPKDDKKVAAKSEEPRKWLQELIEDTAILYCAAAGVQNGDVNQYMNTLDSVQNMQWLGS